MQFRIEPLTPDAVADYAVGHAELVITTYAHLVGPEFAPARRADVAGNADDLRADLAQAASALEQGRPPRRSHWLARGPRGGLVGVAASGWGVNDWESEVCGDKWTPPATDSILDHLYLSPGAQGTGLAQAMLDVALPGRRPAYLWVFVDNPRAIAFYTRNGFVADGLRTSSGDDWGAMPMQRMVRA